MKLTANSKRASIYLIYDKDGIISEYIFYQLEDLLRNLDYLLVVINGDIVPDSFNRLEQYANDILVRDNSGFDVMGFKEGMEYIGWENIYEYDELLLMNDSCYGPLYPFKEVFEEMNKRDVDFWGLTIGDQLDIQTIGTENDMILLKDGYVPIHIQSYFRCIRKNMLCDKFFKKYWENHKDINTFWEAVGYHEIVFTKKFEKKGFKWDVYIDTKGYEELAVSAIDFIPYLLLKNKRLPIVKRKNFFRDYEDSLNNGGVEQFKKTIDYIEKNTNYNMDLIWDDLIRVRNITEIHRKSRINYILPLRYIIPNNIQPQAKVAVAAYITSENMIDYFLTKFEFLPEYIDRYIFTNSSKLSVAIDKNNEKRSNRDFVKTISEKNNSLSALLIEFIEVLKEYEYICYLNDDLNNEVTGRDKLHCIRYCVENLIGSKEYVNNVINTLHNNQKLGLLFPPLPSNIYSFNVIGNEWGDCFNKVKGIIDKFDLNVNISKDVGVIFPFGNMFWCRVSALTQMFEHQWELKDTKTNDLSLTNEGVSKAIERMYSLFAQNKGYLSGWILNDLFASTQMSDMYYSLRYVISNTGITNNSSEGSPIAIPQITAANMARIYENSTSWKVTRPLRAVSKIMHKLFGKKK